MAKTVRARFVTTVLGLSLVIGCGGGGGGGAGGSSAGSGAGTGGGSGRGGAGGLAGTGGSSVAGTTGSAGTGGSVAVNPALKDVIDACAWTTGCLNTEDSGGAAPNVTLSACLASWDSGNEYPWADAKACVAAHPTTCSAFRQCMIDRNVVCVGGGSKEWTRPIWCGDGTRSCTAFCAGTCSGLTTNTCTDATHLASCSNTQMTVTDCSKLDFGIRGASGVCMGGSNGACTGPAPTATGTCGANGASCDGSVSVSCLDGMEYRRDCAPIGYACVSGGCMKGTQCTYERGMCAGNVYQGCLANNFIDVDCVALGGTCGMNRAGRPGCIFPEGTGGAGGTTGAGGRGGTGGSGGTTGAGGAAGTGGGTAGTTGAGGSAGTTGVAGTGGGTAGTTGAGGTGGASCTPNTLTVTAPAVPETQVAQAFSNSAATGGTLVNGTYHLTSLSLFTGPGGATGPTGTNRSETLRITGSTVEVVVPSGSVTQRLTFSAAVSGTTNLTLTPTCPAGGASPTFAFTATATTLTLYVPSNGSNLAEVQVYTLPNPLCTNVFPSSAPAITMNRVAEALPVASAGGGTLVPGTYHLTALTSYTGPGGATGPTGNPRSETIRITDAGGGAFTLEASIAAAMGGTGQWLVLTATTSGTSSIALNQICPTAGSFGSLPYSATTTTFTLYNPSNNTVEAYVKQ